MENNSGKIGSGNKNATILCVQYLISQHLKNRNAIKKDDVIKTLKGCISAKNYDRVMEDVESTIKNVFGFCLSFVDNKLFFIVNSVEEINFPGIVFSSSESLKYRSLLKPIIGALVMHGEPISEGRMWSIMEQFSIKFNLDLHLIKKIVKGDFVKDQYLQYKVKDDTDDKLDPDKTCYWFSLGPRSLIECDKHMLLQTVSELYQKPVTAFKRVHAMVN